jgi:hypothetical protein
MKSSPTVIVGTLLPFVFLAACAPTGYDAPLTGTAGTGPINCGGAPGTSTMADWASVKLLVADSCVGADCHATGDRQPYLFGTTGPLSDADLYTALTTFMAPKCGNRVMVKPCAPDDSAFYRAQVGQCEGAAGIALAYMPYGCNPAPPYENCNPADRIAGVREWIAKGAPR